MQSPWQIMYFEVAEEDVVPAGIPNPLAIYINFYETFIGACDFCWHKKLVLKNQ